MHVRSVRPGRGERHFELALGATLHAAALDSSRLASTLPLRLTREHLRKKLRVHPPKFLVVFLVDASDSMGTEARMAAAKGAVLALLMSAYQRRDRVGVVVFGGETASVLLAPTGSTGLARERLKTLPIGGATPLAHGLLRAWQMIAQERRRDPSLHPRLVLLSDGKANVPLQRTYDLFGELEELGRMIAGDRVSSMVIDASLGGAPELERVARALGTSVRRMARLGAAAVAQAVREGFGEGGRR